ncbi:MAG: dihydrofolate reductase family protein [Nitriliruptorales bacterium]
MTLLERLHETAGLPTYPLSATLERLHGGPFGFSSPRVFANFVTSLDGVVSLPHVAASPAVISGKSEADRFMMGLLRACAGAVLIGASTLRAEPEHRWTPEHVYPRVRDDFAQLRRELELAPRPELVVVTGTGHLDPGMHVLEEGALVLTTRRGADTLATRLPSSSTVMVVSESDSLQIDTVVAVIRSRGHEQVLSEGGPRLLGQLLQTQVLDELFVTFSPILLGRTETEYRPGLVDGVDLSSPSAPRAQVLSVRRHDSHLFVRYLLSHAAGEGM